MIRPPRRKLPQKHPKGSMTQRSHDNLPKQETLWDQCATARDGVLSNRKILPQLAHVPVQSREAEADHRGWWRREFLGTKRVLCMTPKLECGKLKPLTDFMQKVNMDNRKRIRHSWNLKYLKKRVDMRFIVRAQAYARRGLAVRHLKRMKHEYYHAASKIQSWWRRTYFRYCSNQKRIDLLIRDRAATRIQAHQRRIIERELFNKRRDAAIVIQRGCRRRLRYLLEQRMKHAAKKIQCFMMSNRDYRVYQRKKVAITKLQSVARMRQNVLHRKRLLWLIWRMQRAWRDHSFNTYVKNYGKGHPQEVIKKKKQMEKQAVERRREMDEARRRRIEGIPLAKKSIL